MDDEDSLGNRAPANTCSMSAMPGNALFEAAVETIGFDAAVARRLLTSILNTIGGYADTMSPDELGVVLPEIERRLHQLAPSDLVDGAMKRLQQLLFGWEARS